MTSKVDLLLEAERRGILPENKKPLLEEARRRGLVPGGGGGDSSEGPDRSDWTPAMRDVYDKRKKFHEDTGGQHAPGYRQRLQHSMLLGGDDELLAGSLAAVTAPFAWAGGSEESLSDRYNRYWAEQQADLDLMYENTSGGLGVAADIAGALVTGAPKAAASLVTQAAPTLWQTGKSLAKGGAAWGGGHAFLDTDEKLANRIAAVPQGALEGAESALMLGGGILAGLKGREVLRARRAARVERNKPVAEDFREAGVDEFGPAITDSPTAQKTARGLGGSLVGAPIAEGARRSIGQVQTKLNDMMARETGGRPSADLGAETQEMLRHQLTERSRPPEQINEMAPEALQDITGLPLPPKYKPKPVRVDPSQPRPFDPVSPEAYLDEVRAGVPEAPAITPKSVRRENFNYKPEPLPESAIGLGDEVVKPYNKAITDARTAADEVNQIEATINDKIKSLIKEAEELEIPIFQQRGERHIMWPSWPNPRQKAFIDRFNDWTMQRAAMEKRADAAMVRFEKANQEFSRAEVALLDAKNRAQIEGTRASQVSAEARGMREYQAAVRREQEAADAQRALDTQSMREMAADAERPNAVAGAAKRNEALRRQAEEEARRETLARQRSAEQQQAMEIAERRARPVEPFQLGRNRNETYVTEADAAYEMSRRHTPPIQRNPLGVKDDSARTATASLIDKLALESRGTGSAMKGYKEGQLFDEAGNFKPEIAEFLRSEFGDEIASKLRYLAELRSAGQFAPGVQRLHDIRTAIGRALADAKKGAAPGMPRGPSEAKLARLYKAFAEDIDGIRNMAPGGRDATAMRHAIDEDYAAQIDELKKPLGQLFKEGVGPVQALDKLSASARSGDLVLLKAYMRVVSEKGDPIKGAAAIVSHMSRSAKDLGSFLKALGEIPPEARAVMFQGEQGKAYLAELERLERVGNRLAPFERIARDRGTDLSQLARATKPSSLMAAAGLYFNFWPTMMATVGASGLARFMASPRYVRWLSELPNRTKDGINSKAAMQHLARLSGITASDTGSGGAIFDALGSMFLPAPASAQPIKPSPRYHVHEDGSWETQKELDEKLDKWPDRSIPKTGTLDHGIVYDDEEPRELAPDDRIRRPGEEGVQWDQPTREYKPQQSIDKAVGKPQPRDVSMRSEHHSNYQPRGSDGLFKKGKPMQRRADIQLERPERSRRLDGAPRPSTRKDREHLADAGYDADTAAEDPQTQFDSALEEMGITEQDDGVAEARDLARRGDLEGAAHTLWQRAWDAGWGATDGGIGQIDGVYQLLGIPNPNRSDDPSLPDYSVPWQEMRRGGNDMMDAPRRGGQRGAPNEMMRPR